MPNKKTNNTKRVTIKEIVDAFYSGAPVEKVTKMAQRLVEQEQNKKATSSFRDR
jgi:hypothetical protein